MNIVMVRVPVVDSEWPLNGFRLDYDWTLNGFSMDSDCILNEFLMNSEWILKGCRWWILKGF